MTTRPTNAELFADAGRALFGDMWQSPMSRRMGINLRTVQYIAAAAEKGESYRIAPGVMTELVDILRDQSTLCRDLSRKIASFHGA